MLLNLHILIMMMENFIWIFTKNKCYMCTGTYEHNGTCTPILLYDNDLFNWFQYIVGHTGRARLELPLPALHLRYKVPQKGEQVKGTQELHCLSTHTFCKSHDPKSIPSVKVKFHNWWNKFKTCGIKPLIVSNRTFDLWFRVQFLHQFASR